MGNILYRAWDILFLEITLMKNLIKTKRKKSKLDLLKTQNKKSFETLQEQL